MTIHLPPDIENQLIAKVHSGMFPSLDAAMTQAAHLLLEQIEQAPAAKPKRKAKSAKPSPAPKLLTEEEFKQQLLRSGLMTGLPLANDTAPRPEFQPIAIEGEQLSETIIRERR